MKRPLAYVTAAWRGDACEITEQAAKYCRISALEKAVKSYEKHEKDADRFIALIDKYENFDKLTIAMAGIAEVLR